PRGGRRGGRSEAHRIRGRRGAHRGLPGGGTSDHRGISPSRRFHRDGADDRARLVDAIAPSGHPRGVILRRPSAFPLAVIVVLAIVLRLAADVALPDVRFPDSGTYEALRVSIRDHSQFRE